MTPLRLALACVTAVVFATCTEVTTQPPEDAAVLVDPPQPADALRKELANSVMVQIDEALSPCAPARTRAFVDTRQIDVGVWAGEFEVTALGQGNWFLVVTGSGDAAPSRHQVAVDGERWLTPAIRGTSVEIVLEGPGREDQPCPAVTLGRELRGGVAATPRGVVGPDDRWSPGFPLLRELPDATTIESWAPSVVHLQVFDAQRGLPCSGFFVTPHLVMTARHCVMTAQEALNTSLELGSTELRDLLLIMSQDGLDFSLLWVETNDSPPPLALRAVPSAPLVLWQSPAARARVVSVLGCQPVAGGGSLFHHQCDTSVGTSGAPIQDRASGAVVALHTNGCTINGDPQCINFGTPIADIRTRILNRMAAIEKHHSMAAAELRAVLK